MTPTRTGAKRILFLTLYPEGAASPRYRVGQFLPYLRARGLECAVAPAVSEAVWRAYQDPSPPRAAWYHLHEMGQRCGQLLRAHRHDVVVLQKALTSAPVRGLDSLLQHQARHLVYDIDDAVHVQPPHSLRFPWSMLEDREQIRRVMRRAEFSLAGNRWLMSEITAAGGRPVHFPTVVDTDRFCPAAAPPAAFCAGWIGTPSTTPLLRVAAAGLRGVCPVRLVGADARAVDWPEAEVAPWSYDTEVEEVRRFSVGLLPQEDGPWARGKCALKALMYLACGVPCVATPHGAILDLMRDGEHGFFAETPEEWAAAVERLRDPALRRRMGEAGRARVEELFSLRVAAPRLHGLLEGLA